MMALIFASCNEDFLEKAPETSLSTKDFFKTASDLEAYTNGFYDDGALLDKSMYNAWDGTLRMVDFDSDNTSYWRDHDYLLYLGVISPEHNALWKYSNSWGGWGSLRRVNVMLTNLGNTGSIIPADLNHFVGIARYFRAKFYIEKVRDYSDVPWYDKVLESNDPDLYKTQDPRAAVVDSIMKDLEFAAANIKDALGNRTRVNRFVALAEISRFALYEGTYRKYHAELNLASTANRFLERAAATADEIIRSGQFSLASGTVEDVEPGTNIKGCKAFRDLFSSLSLSSNSEIIQWIDYNKTLNVRNRMGNLMLPATHNAYSLSRALMESFLQSDGTPFSTVANYDKKSFHDVFANRDPRLAETFAYPGAHMINPTRYIPMTPTSGGYDQIKYFPESYDKQTSDNNGGWTGIPLYRYAEVLLNYAEAKAELGKLTADDVTRSINLLRTRVGMPEFNAAREVDDDLRAQYPGVSDNNILAVRRERRVELAGEGFRKWDIFRWGAGKLHVSQKALQGIYIPQLPYVYDSDANGNIAGLVAKNADIDALPADIKAQTDNWASLEGLELYLDNGSGTPDPNRTRTAGHIRKSGDDARQFVEPKYYYRPIPKGQIVLNPNLKQPFGWK